MTQQDDALSEWKYVDAAAAEFRERGGPAGDVRHLIDQGVAEQDVAIALHMTVATVRDLLAYSRRSK